MPQADRQNGAVAEGTGVSTEKNGAVELLRILAISAILFHHYQQLSGVYFAGGMNFYNGRFPFQYLVELFFLLSGFLAHRYRKKIEEGQPFLKFLKSRILRLFPGMIAAGLACYALMYLYYRRFGAYWMDIPVNKWKLLITLLGMGAGWFVPCTHINGPAWYVSVLFLCFILFWLLSVPAVKKVLPPHILYCGMVLLGTAGCIVMTIRGTDRLFPFFDIYSCRGYYAFFAGLLLAHRAEKGISVRVRRIYLAAGLGCLVYFLADPAPLLRWINLLLAFVIYPPLLLALTDAVVRDRTKGWTPVIFLGRASYSAYLWHVPFYLGVFYVLLRQNIPLDLQKWYMMLLYGLLSWILGILCYLMEGSLRKAAGRVGAGQNCN